MTDTTPAVILASSSRYRRELLTRLQLDFTCQSPAIDETAEPGEPPLQLVQRLALGKARAVAEQCRQASLVIGSDQVATLGDTVLGKPGDASRASYQLQQMRGRRIEFLTGLCLFNTARHSQQVEVVPFSVKFRNYTDAEIERYVAAEKPFDSAGSFHSEALGVSLVESMSGSDPTALIGLPLIKLCEMLRQEGIALP
ncbi:MAF protein [Methylohalomonas lacus]|uniref:7-methyl-GTP pyrophosphatase n=1 Tax=Methylohalomonas lacus TaxID=398773 RepID=A0AAE3HK27_9GAMM|nr:Maf family protein [Methylohalomonas lacus]MCS3902628.1 MAF protein [Methylohalomonas lacus]